MIQKGVISGIRVIREDFPNLPSAAAGIIFNLGSRDEEEGIAGIVHFVEHTLFKGTEKSSAREISLRAESLGAHIDGFTAKESTGVYARFLKEFTSDVLDLLFEITLSPLFPEEEIEKEKGVIYQEIRETEEDPEERVFSLLFESLFPSHPLGWPITGREETVKTFSRDRIFSYFRDNYTAERVVLILTGGDGTPSLLSAVALPPIPHFWGKGKNLRKRDKPDFPKEVIRVERRRELESVYLLLAQPIFLGGNKRYSLSVLNTAFGGSLSSRLFQKLREEEGLVYQISSFFDLYSDCGLFGIYFVTSKGSTERALKLVSEVRERCRKEGFSQKEIEVALNLTKTSIILSQESPLHRMFALARGELLFGETLTLAELLSRYQKIGLDEVNFLAKEILIPPPAIVAVGDWAEGDLRGFLS